MTLPNSHSLRMQITSKRRRGSARTTVFFHPGPTWESVRKLRGPPETLAKVRKGIGRRASTSSSGHSSSSSCGARSAAARNCSQAPAAGAALGPGASARAALRAWWLGARRARTNTSASERAPAAASRPSLGSTYTCDAWAQSVRARHRPPRLVLGTHALVVQQAQRVVHGGGGEGPRGAAARDPAPRHGSRHRDSSLVAGALRGRRGRRWKGTA